MKYTTPQETSGTIITVLPFLTGRPFDQVAINYIYSLRPSAVEIITRGETMDSKSWRVRVYIDSETNLIEKIRQEVIVGCVGFDHGADLDRFIKRDLRK